MLQTVWSIDTSLNEPNRNRPGDNKAHSRTEIRCKWTPFFLKGEHFITTFFWIADGSPSQVRLRVVEKSTRDNPYSHKQSEQKISNLYVTLKVCRTLDKRKKQNLNDLLDYMDKNFGRFNEVLHINNLHALFWCIWHLNLTSSSSGSTLLLVINWGPHKLCGLKYLTQL